MRIIACHISGFGRLENMDISFDEGLNARLEMNGWGKTTLSVFIKAMFFGMEYSRRRELTEREHYRPWSGATYGGSLTFATNGKVYRIERSFGKREKEDVFALYNDTTGMPSEDYSQAVGEELFSVDRDAFEKSIFIGQGNTATEKSDSLNAKMGDLAAAQDDINHFDEAIGRLEEAKGIYTRRGTVNPGKLMLLKREISDCREAEEKLPALAEGLEKQRALLEEKRIRHHVLEKEKSALQEQITAQSKREQELGAYTEKKNIYEGLKKNNEELVAFFNGNRPTAEDIDVYDEMERKLEINKSNRVLAAERLPEPAEAEKLNRLFKDGALSEEDINRFSEQTERVLNLRVQSEHAMLPKEDREHLTELKVFFNKHYPTEEELAGAQEEAATLAKLDGQVQALEERFVALSARKEMADEEQKTGEPSPFVFSMVASAVLFAGGIALIAFAGRAGITVAVACFVFAVMLAFGAVLLRSRRRGGMRRRKERREEELAEAKADILEKKEEYQSLLDQLQRFLSNYLFSPTDSYIQMVAEIQRKMDVYERLVRQEENIDKQSTGVVEELSALQVQLYTALAPYAEVYGLDLYERHEESETVRKISEDLTTWQAWNEAKVTMEELRVEEQGLRAELNDFVGRFGDTGEKHMKEKLLFIRRQMDAAAEIEERMATLSGEIAAFEATEHVDGETVSVEQLQERQLVTDEELVALANEIVKYKDSLSELADEFEEYEEKAEALAGLLEREQKYKKRVATYEATISYLTEARERYLGIYMGPLRNGLKRYLSMATDEGALAPESFTLDMDLKVIFTHDGNSRQREYLSAGYRDLSAVCARLALMDVLYRKDMPPVILDDVFANLDDEKAVLALAMLRKLAESRQVIYFTCHESRMPS